MSSNLMAEYGSERALWCAVVIQAFRDLKNRSSQDKEPVEDVRDGAWRWLHDRYTTKTVPHPKVPGRSALEIFKTDREGGFEWICDMLDLDFRGLRMKSMTRTGIDEVITGLEAKRRSGRRKQAEDVE